MRSVLLAVFTTLTLGLLPDPAPAAEIYRCPGNVYQDKPCANGVRVDTNTARNVTSSPAIPTWVAQDGDVWGYSYHARGRGHRSHHHRRR